ncbi:MAG: PTS sugar transporter subunit IIA [Thermodesulfobacteriota bacterium]
MILSEYITRERIVFPEETGKLEVIRRLVDKAASLALIRDRAGFEAAIQQREAMSSTGIGLGLAIPHARHLESNDFFIIAGITRHPVEWQAIDAAPVRAIFLIGVPDHPSVIANKATARYLDIIASLMMLVKIPRFRDRLFAAATPDDLMAVLADQSG